MIPLSDQLVANRLEERPSWPSAEHTQFFLQYFWNTYALFHGTAFPEPHGSIILSEAVGSFLSHQRCLFTSTCPSAASYSLPEYGLIQRTLITDPTHLAPNFFPASVLLCLLTRYPCELYTKFSCLAWFPLGTPTVVDSFGL